MERSFGSRIGLVVLTAGAMIGAYYLHFIFLIENCYLGGPGIVPARASLQGQFCGNPDGVPLNLILVGFEAAAIGAVILFVLAWRSARSWAGKLASLTVPAIVVGCAWGAMSLPPDTCSTSEERNAPAGDCAITQR